ncbi:MAG: glycosyltransferase [Planctomycetes bacterium]|nr:glycosyltransferase [Planctomycetota bacterium]
MLETLHVWLPNLPGPAGGIQRFSACLLRALEGCGQVRQTRVIIKNDPVERGAAQRGSISFHTAGGYPVALRTTAFAGLASWLALRERPDLIISVHANFSPLAALLKRRLGIPYWIVAHGVEVWKLNGDRVGPALLNADRVLPVSSVTRQRLLTQLPFEQSRITELPNTLAAEQFQLGPKPEFLLRRHGLRPDQPVLLTIARLVETERYKGNDQVLRALPAIRQAVPGVRYIIGGRGPERGRLERLAAELKVTDCVTFTGFIPDTELADYYRLADVFAMPSNGEGFGIVFLEAMASGKPVLAGNQDGSVDALKQGELGVLVDPHDVSAIAEASVQLLQRTHPHPLVYRPDALRQAMLDAFGPERFQQRVTELLTSFEAAR